MIANERLMDVKLSNMSKVLSVQKYHNEPTSHINQNSKYRM